MIKNLSGLIKGFHKDERGQGMAEYGLIIALVAVLAIAGFSFLGRQINSKVEQVGNTIQNSN